MQTSISIPADRIPKLKEKLIVYSKEFSNACILDSNAAYFKNPGSFGYRKYDLVAGFNNATDPNESIADYKLLNTINSAQDKWYLGYLSYDLKNRIEDLKSENQDNLEWPEVYFFMPEVLFTLANNVITIELADRRNDTKLIIEHLNSMDIHPDNTGDIKLYPRISKKEYLHKVNEIQELIHRGNIYEINFCQEFFNHSQIDPYSLFLTMNKRSPSPFSVFFKLEDKFLLSSSPERFLKKENSLILSQPMKGTSAKGASILEDHAIKRNLSEDVKEKSENIMIVDLVRNDLSRIAKPNSVKVEELCGIYSYPHVHQMISTISAQLNTDSFLEIIEATFPMGSMTGAPKIEAMKIIERYETVKRGLFSGAVGYITPRMNFDFNVVIRSLQYNAKNNYLSYLAGSAITALSDAKKEYDECLIKVYGIKKSIQKANYA